MRDSRSDRNLLLGVLALQMDFITHDALIAAMGLWVIDKEKTLDEILMERGAIDSDDLQALQQLVVRHIARHGGEAEQSLANLPTMVGVVESLRPVVDHDVVAGLNTMSWSSQSDRSETLLNPPRPASGARYQKLRDHAEGGLGVVFLAHDTELNRQVALKEIKPRYADDPESQSRFVVEAEVTGGLEHPGIVPVYGLGRYSDGRPFYAMRFIKGDSLKDAIDQFHKLESPSRDPGDRSLSLQKLLRRFIDVCFAIEYAHSRGILHRDLKPNNVMVGKYGETLVVDWGLAKSVNRTIKDVPFFETTLHPASGNDSAETLPGSVVGTPGYMSPEQAAGELDRMGPASDVYSLGATLYALLTGKAPFAGREVVHLLDQVMRGDFPKPREIVRWLDPALEAICLKAMALNPSDRYPSALALANDVERWTADEPVTAFGEPWTRRARRWAKRHRTAVTASAAVVFASIFLGGGGYVWEQRQRLERVAMTARGVEDALARAERLRGEAQAAPAESLGKWDVAFAAVGEAEGLIRQGEADPPLWGRVRGLLASLKREQADAQQRAEQSQVDRTLISELEATRGNLSEHRNGDRADSEYAGAFRKAGLDLDKTEPKQAGAWILGRADPIELASYLDHWSLVRRAIGCDEPSWKRLVEAARTADPDPWRDALRVKVGRKDAEAVAEFRRLADHVIALQAQPVKSLVLLARSLKDDAKDREQAERVLRLAAQDHPDDYWVNFDLALAGLTAGGTYRDPAEAVRHLSAALALRPLSLPTRLNLGSALHYLGKLDEEIAQYRAAIRLKPDFYQAHYNLGNAFLAQGKVDEAIAAWRAAIQANPDHADARGNIAFALASQGRFEEAMTESRAAIRRKPDDAVAHFNLGVFLSKAGHYEDALKELRRGHELGSKLPNWRRPSAEMIRQCELLTALGARFPAVLEGKDQPKNASEGMDFGELCFVKGLYASAVRLWADAFTTDPKLTEDRRMQYRYNAACLAALAASGKSKDDPPPDDLAKAKLRKQAREWLEAELAAWSKFRETAKPADRELLLKTLAHWNEDADITCVRDEVELAKLPEAERSAFRRLWRGVDDLLEKAAHK